LSTLREESFENRIVNFYPSSSACLFHKLCYVGFAGE
jgi:hypothetical protein